MERRTERLDVLVVGAGFAGLRALHTFRSAGHAVAVLEAGDGIGGVWYHNGYPGARCDVESYDYSYGFSPELEQEWRWSERYATQPEILRYVNHVAARFDLNRDVRLNTRMTRAAWDETEGRWRVEAETTGGTTTGEALAFSARYLVLCMGQLSAPKDPVYPGMEAFEGRVIHSARWPREPVDLAGKRVGIIGTGSSGMQMTPIVAGEAGHLTVFQRTANFSVPAANAPVTDEEDRAVKADYAARRLQARNSPTGLGFRPNRVSALDATPEEREAVYEAAYHRLGFGFALAYYDILLSKPANDTAAEFVRRKIGERIEDPALRDKLVPQGHPFAARRPSVDSGYFETFNRPNVTLADLREAPILAFERDGIRTAERLYALDVVIFATGFDVFTGALFKAEIVGRGGATLKARWADGPQTYLGAAVAGFPNMLIVAGPGSPSLLSNVLLSIEEQVDWFAGLLAHADGAGGRFEAEPGAEAEWVAHVNERVRETLYMTTTSYYNGAEVSGKARVFMPYSGGVRGYRRVLEACAGDGYRGFAFPAAETRRASAAVAG